MPLMTLYDGPVRFGVTFPAEQLSIPAAKQHSEVLAEMRLKPTDCTTYDRLAAIIGKMPTQFGIRSYGLAFLSMRGLNNIHFSACENAHMDHTINHQAPRIK